MLRRLYVAVGVPLISSIDITAPWQARSAPIFVENPAC
jgi:hypothetical protein